MTVLEGRERVGGRVWTMREGFADGQFAEIGAVRIPDVHDHTLGYVEELGLELDTYPEGEPLYFIKDTRFMHTEGEAWPLQGLNATEMNAGLLELWETYIKSSFDEIGNRRDGSFPRPGVIEKYDGQIYSDFLRERGASEAFLSLYASDNGSEVFTTWRSSPSSRRTRWTRCRVHFAGEHTSIWAGWMQGAIESAKRTVQEIVDFKA